jgi:lipopolysaccharide biosynthesis regulator YciM
MKALLLITLLSLSLEASAFVKDPVYDDLDGYELVSALIRDGKLELAWEELKLDSIKNKDAGRYELLVGKYYMGKNEWSKALDHFKKAQRQTSTMAEADLLAARSKYQLKQYKDCQDLYSKTTTAHLLLENDFILKSQCEYKNQSPQKAWATLLGAKEKFPSFAIERELISLKSSLGMAHEALTDALQWLHSSQVMSSQFMNLAEIFHGQKQENEALMILEAGRAREPMNAEINLTLSQMYFQKNLMQASAEGFSRAAESDSKYYYHAAELQRQLGNNQRSNYYNIYIEDPKEKLKQRIAGLVDMGNFPLIASLESVIQRSELSKDDEIRYALAYSLVREGQIDTPLKYLSQITRPELLEKTTVLRKTLIDCQEKKSSCRL